MSSKAIPKSRKSPKTRVEEEEPSLVKIMRFMGWIYLLLIIAILGYIGLEAIVNHDFFGDEGMLNSLKAEVTIMKLALALVFAVSSGIFFGTSNLIKQNPQKKKELFTSLIISELLVSFILIFAIAFAQPIPW
ncbi:MAG: hypothetical protein ACTSRZ_18630 [Promethearchaeota archaeon]